MAFQSGIPQSSRSLPAHPRNRSIQARTSKAGNPNRPTAPPRPGKAGRPVPPGPDGTGPAALPASASTGIPGIPGIQGSPPPRPLTPGAPCGRNNDEVPPVLGQDRPGPASLHQKRTRGPWVRFFGSEFRSTPQRGPSGAGSRAGPGLCIPAFRAFGAVRRQTPGGGGTLRRQKQQQSAPASRARRTKRP